MEDRRSSRGEWLKFGALILVFLGVVGAVALARPLVFEQMVPAFLGEFFAEPETLPAEAPAGSETDAEADAEVDAEPTVEEEKLSASEMDAGAEAAPGSANEMASDEEVVDLTAQPGEDLIHTVQAGENLTAIARNYGVSVEAILTLNEIENADRITAGDELRIPRP
jgi:LysM repeat protein